MLLLKLCRICHPIWPQHNHFFQDNTQWLHQNSLDPGRKISSLKKSSMYQSHWIIYIWLCWISMGKYPWWQQNVNFISPYKPNSYLVGELGTKTFICTYQCDSILTPYLVYKPDIEVWEIKNLQECCHMKNR